MPKISYMIKGELVECERERLSECVEVMIKGGRWPEGTTIARVVNVGGQRIEYQYKHKPHTPSDKKRREPKPKKEATIL